MKDQESAASQPQTDLRADCPSCRHIHTHNVRQCDSCGVIFSKWKEPKQRQAEAKLAAIAATSNTGLPGWIGIALVLLFGIPALIAFVPDVGTRILGAKLRYRFEPAKTLAYRGTAQVMLEWVPIDPATAGASDPVEIILESAIVAGEGGSGGNVEMGKTFSRLSIQPGQRAPLERNQNDLLTWNRRWIMGARGGTISMMNDSSKNMQASANTMRYVNEARAKSAQELADRLEDPSSGSTSAAPPPYDTFQNFIQVVGPTSFGHLDMVTMVEFPHDRVKPGDEWMQRISMLIPTRVGDINVIDEIPFRLRSLKRQMDGFVAVVAWDSPIKISLAMGPNQPYFLNSTVSGTTSGQAIYDFKTGELKTAEGETRVSIVPSSGKLLLLQNQLGVSGSWSGFNVSQKHRVTKL